MTFRHSFSQSCLFINVISYKCAFNKILHCAKIKCCSDNQRKMNGRNRNPQRYSLFTLYSLKNLFDFNGQFIRAQHRNTGSGPPDTHKDTRNTFSKILWLTHRLLPNDLSENRSICGQFNHNSITLSANPIYMALWTALHSLSNCLDVTLWKTLCKLAFGLLNVVQCS